MRWPIARISRGRITGRCAAALASVPNQEEAHAQQRTPRYDGPRELAQSLTAFACSAPGATLNRESLRADSEYRDLGLAAATNGPIESSTFGRLSRSPIRRAGIGTT